MTEKEILEGNKTIALFMGWEKNPCAIDIIHESWDWIMPVVEKIEAMGYDTMIFNDFPNSDVNVCYHGCEIYRGDLSIELPYVETKIKAVWQAVLAFLTWYNSQLNS